MKGCVAARSFRLSGGNGDTSLNPPNGEPGLAAWRNYGDSCNNLLSKADLRLTDLQADATSVSSGWKGDPEMI